MASVVSAVAIGSLQKVLTKIVSELWNIAIENDTHLKEFAQLLKNEKIINIRDQVDGIIFWMDTTYTPRKNAGAERSELYNWLLPYEVRLSTQMIPPLMSDELRLEISAQEVFKRAAAMHIQLLQELAFLDPHLRETGRSSYLESISLVSRSYAHHVKITIKDIRSKKKGEHENKLTETVTRRHGIKIGAVVLFGLIGLGVTKLREGRQQYLLNKEYKDVVVELDKLDDSSKEVIKILRKLSHCPRDVNVMSPTFDIENMSETLPICL